MNYAYAQKAYEAYCNHTNWKSLATGCELPKWDELKDCYKDAWKVAACNILERNVMQENVHEWSVKFEAEVNSVPTIPSQDVKTLRKKLIEEEVINELFPAIDNDDIVEIADAIADTLYVVFGTAIAYGINIQPIFDEVHRSNMSKANPDGTVTKNEFGKVVKPPTYSKADVKSKLEAQRRD